jgi:hypothetical protein
MANTRNHGANDNENNNGNNPPPPPTLASIDNASSDIADHATNYGQHAASSRTPASATTPALRQAWRVSED